MKKTLSIGAKMKLIELRCLLEHNMIRNYRDFKENHSGSGNVSYKIMLNKPVQRITYSEFINFNID